MKITIRGKGSLILTQRNFLSSGGQGDIYLKDTEVYKVYHEPKHCLPEAKIHELSVLDHSNIVKPEDMIYDEKNRPVGYYMKYVDDTILLTQMFPKSFKDRNNVTNDLIVKLVQKMQQLIGFVHSKQILIVDLNENNFIMKKSKFDDIYAIDVDSYQTKSFPATVIMENIKDPHATRFNELTDWYSFAIIACQLFLGIHPFKGKHPSIHGFPERMKANISVFNKSVDVPKIVPDFKIIPETYRKWFIQVFEKGERIVPPTDVVEIITIMKVVKTITGNDVFDIKEFITGTSDIVRYFYLANKDVILTVEGDVVSGKNVWDMKRQNMSIGFTPKMGDLVTCYTENNHIKLFNLTRKQDIPCDIEGDQHMTYDGRLYVKNDERILEVSFMEGMKTVALFETVCNVLPSATHLYEGCVIQNLLGMYYLSIFPETKTHYQIALKDLKGMRIHSAKYQNKILMVIAEDKGQYHKFIYKICSTFDGYQVYIRKDISILETNFVVLDSGICAHIDQDGEIELFLNRIEKNDIKIVKSPEISVDMKLFNKGTQTLFAKDEKLYSLKMK